MLLIPLSTATALGNGVDAIAGVGACGKETGGGSGAATSLTVRVDADGEADRAAGMLAEVWLAVLPIPLLSAATALGNGVDAACAVGAGVGCEETGGGSGTWADATAVLSAGGDSAGFAVAGGSATLTVGMLGFPLARPALLFMTGFAPGPLDCRPATWVPLVCSPASLVVRVSTHCPAASKLASLAAASLNCSSAWAVAPRLFNRKPML